MSNNVLAQLKVLIGADVSKLKSGLNEAQVASEKSSRKIEHNFHHMGTVFERLIGPLSATGREISVAMDAIGASAAEANKSMASMGTALAVTASVGTAAFAALAGITVKLFDGLEETAHAAAGVGMGVAQYTQLTEALKVFDINQEQANQALAYFDKILSGLVRSKAGAEAIKELGLNMQALRKMDPHDALLAIADAFSKLQDGTMKAGIAAALFENTYGIKLIPFLNQGSKGIEELESKYKGLANATAANTGAAENLTEAWSAFKANLEGLTLEVSSGFGIPTMLEAIAHPLKTLEVLILGFGDLASKVFRDIARDIGFLVKEMNSGLSYVHLPQIPTSGLSEAAQYFQNLSTGFGLEAGKIAEGIVSSGQHGPGGGGIHGGNGSGGHGNKPNKAAGYLAQLHEQLAEFGKSDVARGLDHLKALGATQSQLAQGRGLLAAIQALKDEKAFAEQFEKSEKSMGKLLDKLKVPTEQVKGLASSFADLTNRIRETGAAAMGIHTGIGPTLKAQGASIALGGGKIGGNVGVFTPSGFGKMRFNMDALGTSAKDLGRQFSESFTRMIESGQGFSQMLQDLAREFETFALKQGLFKLLGGFMGSKGGFAGVIGNFFTGLSAPGRATGGPVSAGGLYMVGERGPELFSPRVAGNITPNHVLARMGASTSNPVYHQTFNVHTPDADSFQKSQGQIMSEGLRRMARAHARNS